jgi:putative flippase GtrA
MKFIGLSGIGWILDFGTYTGLGLVWNNLVVNNTISSWVGVTFVFIFATRKVFNNVSKIPLKWKYVIYLLYQCILIFLISKLLNKINVILVTNIEISFVQQFSAIIAKILVTPLTMFLNFLVMKGIIEKL